MSGQWEVVRGKNDRKSKLPVSKTAGKQTNEGKPKKTNILNGVRIDEVLPKSQVQNLYSGKQANKENKPVVEKQKVNETKKPEKKSNNKGPSETPKPKPPKSIEAGLLAINTDEFVQIFEKSKLSFPDAPIVWLKELTQFLNQKLPLEIQDPVFSNKPIGYPLSVVPSPLKSTIEKAIKEAGKSNAQLYFDIALTSMVTDLSKGLSAVGYRFFLQQIALSEPKLVTENLTKHVSLRNSYQNRANVALSILWSVGHVGNKDLQCGLKVFEDLMLPLLEMKSYSQYVLKYLVQLTNQDFETQLTKEQYLLILDTAFSSKKNLPAALQKDLVKNVPKLKKLLFSNKKERYNSYVEVLLKKINATTNVSYQNALCDILIDIFNKDQSTLAVWNKVYSKNLLASAVLLRYMSDNRDSLKPNLKKDFKELLAHFSAINEELSQKRRKDEGLKEAMFALKKAKEQKKEQKKSSGVFGKFLSTLFLLAFILVLTEPFYRLSKPRADLYMFRIARKVGEAGLWLDGKLAKNVPKPYYGQAKEFMKPYGALAGDLLQIGVNIHDNAREAFAGFVDEKYPIVVASIDNYAPGLIDNTQVIFNDAFAKSIHYYQSGVNYLQKEVFVGELSPENIQRVVVTAYNTTSEKAIEYYHWVYQKVQTSIK
ncbi:transmembrane protein 214 [Anthonomus grandis grandis]|uniref:transmembrane protein 214 n=1 Tax=Anthonomus grandis grandis TaxID=2921223 RepID=UPI0021667ED4|nr:transmembrane protein 214 [Anthonomus grandis grandis]